MKAELLISLIWFSSLVRTCTGSSDPYDNTLGSYHSDASVQVSGDYQPISAYMSDIFDIMELETDYGERKREMPAKKHEGFFTIARSINAANVTVIESSIKLEFVFEEEFEELTDQIMAASAKLVLPRVILDVEENLHDPNENVIVQVYEEERGEYSKTTRTEQRNVTSLGSGYEEFDVTMVLRSSLSGRADGLTIQLTCTESVGKSACSRYFDFEITAERSPLLVMYAGIEPVKWIPSRQRRAPRSRRSRPPGWGYSMKPGDCDVGEPVYLRYHDIGWTFVVRPEGVKFHFCKGDCPLPLNAQFNSTNYSFLMSFYKKNYPDSPPPTAKCVAIDYEGLEIMKYTRWGWSEIQRHMFALARQCGCR